MINPPAPDVIPTRTPHVAYRIHPVYKSCHPGPGVVPRALAVIPTKGTVCPRGGIPYYNSPEIIFPGCL